MLNVDASVIGSSQLVAEHCVPTLSSLGGAMAVKPSTLTPPSPGMAVTAAGSPKKGDQSNLRGEDGVPLIVFPAPLVAERSLASSS